MITRSKIAGESIQPMVTNPAPSCATVVESAGRPDTRVTNSGPVYPDALRQRKQWLYTERGQKTPVGRDGTSGKWNTPEQFLTFDEAKQRATVTGGHVGFVVTADDPIVCLDLDNAITADGEVREWAVKILKCFPDTYCETSPSGHGFHIWIQATDGHKERAPKATLWTGNDEKAQACEVFSKNKFIIVTGNVRAGSPTVVANKQAAFDGFVTDLLLPTSPPKSDTQSPDRTVSPPARCRAVDGNSATDVPLEERIRRATQYVLREKESVAGANGHDTCFNVTLAVVKRFDLADTESVMQVMRDYNQHRCRPAWTEVELQHKVRDALTAKRTDIAVGSGLSPAAATRTARGVDYRIFDTVQMEGMTEDIEYLVERTLVKGQPCILAGPKKCLKTSLLVDLAVSLASGQTFLGHLAVAKPTTVLLMSGESGLATLKETVQRVAVAKRVKTGEFGTNLLWSTTVPKIGDHQHLAELARCLRHHAVEVLMVDPAYLAMPSKDAANLMAQGELLRAIAEICQEAEVTLILCHHTKKTGKVDPYAVPDLEEIAYAGYQEFARQWILVGRRERYREGSGQHRIWLSTGGSAGHSAIYGVDVNESTDDIRGQFKAAARQWDVTIQSGGAVIDLARTEKTERRKQRQKEDKESKVHLAKGHVLDILKRSDDGETVQGLKDLTGCGKEITDAIMQLVAEGHLEECKVRRASRSYSGYRACRPA